VVGTLAGSYPALVLPATVSLHASRGAQKSTQGSYFRKALVIFQFSISILLIVGTVAVYRQIDYLMTKNLGLDKSNVVMLELEGELAMRRESYKAELQKIPGVESVTLSSGNPLSYGRSSSSPTWEGKDPQQEVEINIMTVDTEFTSAMKMTILEGRGFSVGKSDSANYIINERAASIMGFENPVGKSLTVWGTRGEIIGVVADFHMSSLYEPIAPLIMRQDLASTEVALVRVTGSTLATIPAIESITKSFNPALPFAYSFLDETYAANYSSERIVSVLVGIFSVMAIFISCLGLLGLCSFSAELRRKELGIRRIHGASKSGLIVLMSSEYAALISIAIVIAAPAAWYVANQWLSRFAFRADLGMSDLVVAAVILVAIAGATVTFKSYQAASANPADTLREQ
jgi:putative ABC transport system permease protein